MNWKYFCDDIHVFLHDFTNVDAHLALVDDSIMAQFFCQPRDKSAKVA
jgi:hypothetical protein